MLARTAKSESRSPFLNDVNEEMDGLEVIGTHANQVGADRSFIDLCIDGLVLLESLSVAVLIRPSAGPAC